METEATSPGEPIPAPDGSLLPGDRLDSLLDPSLCVASAGTVEAARREGAWLVTGRGRPVLAADERPGTAQ